MGVYLWNQLLANVSGGAWYTAPLVWGGGGLLSSLVA